MSGSAMEKSCINCKHGKTITENPECLAVVRCYLKDLYIKPGMVCDDYERNAATCGRKLYSSMPSPNIKPTEY